MCTLMFIAALFSIDKIQKEPKCPLTDECYKESVVYVYTMKDYSTVKKNEILPFATTQMDLEGLMLSEISQTKTNTT